jgi:hypothetical protein
MSAAGESAVVAAARAEAARASMWAQAAKPMSSSAVGAVVGEGWQRGQRVGRRWGGAMERG